MFFSISVTLAL